MTSRRTVRWWTSSTCLRTASTRYPDYVLPHTGADIEPERSLSSIFVSRDGYGTRCSTIILIDRGNRMTFLERSFDEYGNGTGTVEYNI